MVCDLEVKRSRLVSPREIQAKEEGVEVEESSSARKRFEELLTLKKEKIYESDVEKKHGIFVESNIEVCGWTKGHARHIQTWWWNEEVWAVIEMKKVKFREWQKAKASPSKKK